MKRQVLAIALGSLFALPAFANNEIDAGNPAYVAPESTKTRNQVLAEIVAAKSSNDWRINAELGTQSRPSAPVQFAGKSRSQVREEVAQARSSGDYVVNAELGTTARQL
jgi:hypothetical protein